MWLDLFSSFSFGVTKNGGLGVYIREGLAGAIDEQVRLDGRTNLAYGLGVQRLGCRYLYGSCTDIRTKAKTDR